MSKTSTRRLQLELRELQANPDPFFKLASVPDSLQCWTLHMLGAPGTLYEGEKFTLRFVFNDNYPFEAPEVTFVPDAVPVHPHVYSNGHVCISVLSDGAEGAWSPALTVSSVCQSILSMLSSCKLKERPPDNDRYVSHCARSPKKTKWAFHDDTV